MPDSRTLTVALVGGPMYDRLYERLPEFERESGCRVKVAVRLNHPSLNARMEEDYSRGGDPGYDLISTHSKYAPSQRSFLEPLDEELLSIDLGDFSAGMLEHARIEGKLYGLPRNIDVKLLYYRTDLLEGSEYRREFRVRYGRDLRVPESWDELIEVAEFFARPPGLYGFVFPGKYSGLFGHFFELNAMAGGDIFGGAPDFRLDDEAGRWALGLLAGLYRGGSVPADVTDWHYDEVTQFFLEGRAAMTTDWPGGYHLFKNPETSRVSDKFGVALYPVGPAGQRWVYSGGHTFAIPRSVRDREGALSLLRFLTSEKSQYLEAAGGAIPVRASVENRIRTEAATGSLDERRLQLLGTTVKHHMLIPPKFPEYPSVEDALWTSLRAAITGETTVEEGLARASREIRRIMKPAGGT